MKALVRKILQNFGYDIIKLHPKFNPKSVDSEAIRNEFRWLINYDFKTIIDVGANEGQFSSKARILFPGASIYAFEPIPPVYSLLTENFKKDHKFVAYNIGLGESNGTLQFNQNESSASSSFLQMEDAHVNNFEFTREVETISVDVNTLDNIFEEKNLEEPILIKLDVQGYEKYVINGGVNTLSKAKMVITELSYVELYKGQELFDGIYKLLNSLGFRYMGNYEQLYSPIDNSVLQADGIFVKY